MARTVRKGWIGKIYVVNENGQGVQVNDNGFFAIAGSVKIDDDDNAATIRIKVYRSKALYKSGDPAVGVRAFEYRVSNDILVSNGAGGQIGLFDKYFASSVPGKEYDNAVSLLNTLTGNESWNTNNIPFSTMVDAGT